MIFQPRLSRWVKARAAKRDQPVDAEEGEERDVPEERKSPSMPAVSLVLILLVFLAGIYGATS